MNAFVRFMASPAGRILRIVAGAAIIVYGLVAVGGPNGKLVAAIGLLPILTGTLNICVIAPLFGKPLSGSKVTAANG
jgi:xanthosine utilization system XapX-like protein